MGPKVTGMIYVKRDKIEKLWPLLPPPADVASSDIRKFEALGTMTAVPLAIGEAITFHNGIGTARKAERFRYLTDYWVKKVAQFPKIRFFTSITPEMSCAVVNVGVEGINPKALADYLWNSHRLLVTTVLLESIPGIRVSPSLHNTHEELDRFCEIIEHVSKKGPTAE